MKITKTSKLTWAVTDAADGHTLGIVDLDPDGYVAMRNGAEVVGIANTLEAAAATLRNQP